MLTHLTWFVVVFGSAAAVALAVRTAQYAAPLFAERVSRRTRLVLGLCALLLVGLGVVGRFRPVAAFDGSIVSGLVPDRGPALTGVMTVVTTIGDVVPSLTIAAALALALFLSTKRLAAWALPALLIVQLAVQVGFADLFHDVMLTDVRPLASIGGSGTIPSGSVSRLFSLFFVAALIVREDRPRFARTLLHLGPVLVLIEIVTRLYLGRHLIVDIFGGLLLGVMLCVVSSLVISAVDRPKRFGSRGLARRGLSPTSGAEQGF